MSWYCNSERICKKCGNKFKSSEDTLSIAAGNNSKCPQCGEMNTEVTKDSIYSNKFIERLKKTYI